jgi:glucose/arabinose dehydrogenase
LIVRTALGVVLASVVLAVPATAESARLVRVASNFDAPIHVKVKRQRMHVVEQEGQIWRKRTGGRTLFLDIRGDVSCCGERGLLSIEFDADYGTNRFFYVNYTDNGGDVVFARFRANSTFTRGVLSSRVILATVEHSSQGNHNGGQIVWGPDGRLYMSTGDGGGSCDPGNNAQDTSSWLGKIFSMNPDNLGAGRRMEVYGLRNPWRFSFDRQTGRLYIGDVGQGSWEEIDTQSASALGGALENYGWRVYEGFAFNPCGDTTLEGPSGRRKPIDVYSHSRGCSVTGGFAYRGRAFGSRSGWYHFGDYCSGRIWRLLFRDGRLVADHRLVLDTSLNITSFGEDSNGELLVVHHGGTIYRLAP